MEGKTVRHSKPSAEDASLLQYNDAMPELLLITRRKISRLVQWHFRLMLFWPTLCSIRCTVHPWLEPHVQIVDQARIVAHGDKTSKIKKTLLGQPMGRSLSTTMHTAGVCVHLCWWLWYQYLIHHVGLSITKKVKRLGVWLNNRSPCSSVLCQKEVEIVEAHGAIIVEYGM